MLGPQIGFGPVYLQKPGTRFKRCEELHTQPCDVDATDQCCAVVPCTYCLRLEEYGEEDVFGYADFSETAWMGEVSDVTFRAYWERNEYTGECEFVIEVNGSVVDRLACEQGMCRDSSGSTVLEDGRTLYWDKRLQKPLQYVKADDGCTDHFCGDCECTCKELCIRIGDVVVTLEMDAYDTDCDEPVWIGTIQIDTDEYDVELRLVRGEYDGECYLEGEFGGESLVPQLVEVCTSIAVSFTTSAGTMEAYCKVCDCEPSGCTSGCCFPYEEDFPCATGVYGRRLKTLTWTLSAPNCPALDGLTGSLSPETTCPHESIGPCGNCVCYVNDAHGSTFIPGVAYFEDGYDCDSTPCGFVQFCFNITCNPREAGSAGGSIQNCCSRIKLLILIQGSTSVSGGNPVDFTRPNECVESGDGLVSFLGCDGNPGQTLISLDPSSCSCFDAEQAEEFEVVYDLSQISFGCSEFFESGPCEGNCRDCNPINCSFAGATLVVVQGEP